MKILAFIPARGGSVRIPKKNIKLLAGKPLISYTIECARKSKYINRIIVCTDDNDIAKVSRRYGAEVPFMRPKNISQSDSTELQVFKYALKWLKKNEGYEPDLIVKIFATSPFRTPASVDGAIELLLSRDDADAVRSVRLCSEHPYKMWTIKNGWLEPLIPAGEKPKEGHTLSYQVLPKVYIQNACIDVTRSANIFKKNSVTGNKILPFVMSAAESVDINTPLDLYFAEELFGLIRKKKIKL
jgi:N-acylneuraminate cytidylyltransferase